MLSAACTSTWMNGARKTGRYRVMRQQDKRADWETEDKKKKKEKFIKGQRMDEAKVNLRTEMVRDEWKWMLRWIRMRGEDDREEMDMGEESKERGREGVTALTWAVDMEGGTDRAERMVQGDGKSEQEAMVWQREGRAGEMGRGQEINAPSWLRKDRWREQPEGGATEEAEWYGGRGDGGLKREMEATLIHESIRIILTLAADSILLLPA